MRSRLLNLWDSERLILERQKPGNLDVARLDQLAKAAITIARIPGRKDLAPANPATRDAQGKRQPELRGGATGALISAMRTPDTPDRHDSGLNHASEDDADQGEAGARSGSHTHDHAELAA